MDGNEVRKVVHSETERGRAHNQPSLKSVRRMQNLVTALGQISRRPVGVDGLPYQAYAAPRDYLPLNPNLLDAYPDLNPMGDLQHRILFGDSPDPAEQIRVKGRFVERGTVANRIIERAVANKLSLNFDTLLSDASWGYRSGRSPEQAIQRVRDAIRHGAHFAFRTDIRQFFPSVNRNVLESELRSWIRDQSLVEFIMTSISPVLLVNGRPVEAERSGLPQGNGLTPFLSNLYLHPLDQALSAFHYFRFADDIFVIGKTHQEVAQAKRLIKGTLSQLGLHLNTAKTFTCDLYRQPAVFLGFELRGGNVYPPKKAIKRLEWQLRVRGREDGRAVMEAFVRRYRIGPVRKVFRRLDQRLGQWYPPGVTLVGLLVSMRPEGVQQTVRNGMAHLGIPDGKGREYAD